jgi:hypothetical protein
VRMRPLASGRLINNCNRTLLSEETIPAGHQRGPGARGSSFHPPLVPWVMRSSYASARSTWRGTNTMSSLSSNEIAEMRAPYLVSGTYWVPEIVIAPEAPWGDVLMQVPAHVIEDPHTSPVEVAVEDKPAIGFGHLLE